MRKTLADVRQELLAVDTKLKTNPDDDTLEKKHELLLERSQLLLEELKPLRSVVSSMAGVQATMAGTKKWTEGFGKLSPTAQMKMYEDAFRAIRPLAQLLSIDIAPEPSETPLLDHAAGKHEKSR
jgi:hypothetical protein